MEHQASTDFSAQYGALPRAIRKRADKQFALLKENPQHPSLQNPKNSERRHYSDVITSPIQPPR